MYVIAQAKLAVLLMVFEFEVYAVGAISSVCSTLEIDLPTCPSYFSAIRFPWKQQSIQLSISSCYVSPYIVLAPLAAVQGLRLVKYQHQENIIE